MCLFVCESVLCGCGCYWRVLGLVADVPVSVDRWILDVDDVGEGGSDWHCAGDSCCGKSSASKELKMLRINELVVELRNANGVISFFLDAIS